MNTTRGKIVQQIMDEMEKTRLENGEKADECRKDFILYFCTNMICHVLIEFSGSGDSGCIDDIIIEYVDGHEPAQKDEKLHEDLDNWAHSYLESTGIDWYNNDGGQGQIEFDLRTMPFVFRSNVDVNQMTSETAFSCEEIA